MLKPHEITTQLTMPFAKHKDIFARNECPAELFPRPKPSGQSLSQFFHRFGAIARMSWRNPFAMVAALWPLVILAPHLPGIPRPSVNGLPWRQELALSFLLTLGLFFLIRQRRNRFLRIERHSLLAAASLGVFAVWIWLSAVWAVAPYPAVHLAIQWTIYLVFFLVVTSVAKNPRVVRSSLVTLAAVVSVLAIACAIESWLGAPLTDGNLRSDLKPVLRGSAGFGEIMAMASILFAGLALHVGRNRQALICGCIAVLTWLATLQSLERSPFVGAIAGLALLIIGTLVARFRNRQTLLRLCLLIGALGLVLFTQTISTTANTQNPTSTIARLNQNLGADPNTRVRFLFWGVGLEMVRKHPLAGVGGNNYEVAFASARARYSAQHPDSPLIKLNEHLLTVYAHNEYVQLLAELGLVGFAIFLIVCSILVASLWRALRHKHLSLPALGAGGAMLAFAVSSGASGSSFRYFGGALLFFFCAALLVRIAAETTSQQSIRLNRNTKRLVGLSLCTVTLSLVVVLSFQAAGTVLHGLAQNSSDAGTAEKFYRASLRVSPSSAATHYSYGMWLYQQRRSAEAVPHMRYAVKHGFNSSVCYAYLAAMQNEAGYPAAAEATLANGVRVYPASIFLLARHSSALAQNGKAMDSESVFDRALALDARAARGWRQLIDHDIDAAYVAAKQDSDIAMPGELAPEAGVLEVLQENERRFPGVANIGFRVRMKSKQVK